MKDEGLGRRDFLKGAGAAGAGLVAGSIGIRTATGATADAAATYDLYQQEQVFAPGAYSRRSAHRAGV